MEKKNVPIFKAEDVSVSFRMYDGVLEQKELRVISSVSFHVDPGEVVAVVGSSGSGKSILASAILGILPENAAVQGKMWYRGRELTSETLHELRGSALALVPQSVAYLDPLMKVGKQVDGHRKPKRTARRIELFQRFGLPENTSSLYPFQLSGGMARRVLVSTALIENAELVIADEPTPGMSLDQAKEALSMLRQIAEEGKGVILITHDIDLVLDFADRIVVFYAGTTVETASASDFRTGPEVLRHPYSKALWRALPQNDFQPIGGTQPYAGNLPKGCPFGPRCPYRTGKCEETVPPVQQIRGGEVRCYHAT